MNTIQDYYQLKQSYQENINRRKKIIKKKDISIKEKKTLIKQIIGKCVNCGKSGGTIFEEKNGFLKAVCGNTTQQCDLNINIKRKLYDNVREIEQTNNKLIENLKLRIIMTKLDYLFGVNSSKDETVDKFNTLKHDLASLSEVHLINLKKYGDIISGIHREPLLNDATMDLIQEINELKQLYKTYQEKKTVVYLTAMIEMYITKIKPLTEKIRNMNYGYYALENDNDTLDNSMDNGDGDGDDGDGEKSKGVRLNSSIHNLIARAYRFEQFEEERK